ncbi:MAG: cytochrome c1 [Proteobacteria bacterium]|jgi:ubiquinol-cytochrome c reductase cytochrome c1 subunit|nr:cytochrome c1 [Pseudomonadota bacterium]
MKTNNLVLALVVALPFIVSVPNAIAATAEGVVLDPIHVDSGDTPSLQRGASLFVNYCLSCHGAAYMRYERLAYDLDIPMETLAEEYMFTTDKPGDLMKTAMSEDDAKAWFGVAPPDLTLVSRVRKNDWLYTYLRAFYLDENSPSGWNNSLFENVAMPHVLYELQGAQTLVGHVESSEDESTEEHTANIGAHQNIVGDAIFEIQKVGKNTPEEFDTAMYDLVNFLSYLAEPAQLQRRSIGIWVLAWLVILFVVSYLLKKEYWRDVH